MSDELFSKLISEISENIPPFRVAVLYHGGEPLLNPRIPQMISDLKSVGMPLVKMVSNGMLLSGELAHQIVSSGLDQLEVSLDGGSAKESDAIRTRSSADAIIDNVQKFLDLAQMSARRLKVTISTTQFRTNRESLEPETPNWLRGHFEGRDVDFKATWAVAWPSGDHDSSIFESDIPGGYVPPRNCSFLDETLTVRADGTVVPCCYDLTTAAPLGNLNVSSIEEIWNSEGFAQFRRNFVSGNYPPLCQGCAVVTGPRYLRLRRSLRLTADGTST